jgi:hypothetical protein
VCALKVMLNESMKPSAFELRFASPPLTSLGTFTVADTIVAAQVKIDDPEVALNGARPRWTDELLPIIGFAKNTPTKLGYMLFDGQARVRGSGALAFTGKPAAGAMRTSVDEVAIAATAGSFTSEKGGTIHVAFSDGQKSGTKSYQVIYYDQLRCVPKP